MILKQGASGPDVEQLQLKLKAAGYDPGDVDGIYGRKTTAAVLAFQADRPDLDDDALAGPMTIGALDAAVAKKMPDKGTRPGAALPGTGPVPCELTTWTAFRALVDAVTKHPVCYGPGRGLWDGDRYLITYAPGRRSRPGDEKTWPNALGKRYPAFHCSSWTNFVLGWLFRRNQDYTHAGNIPSLFDLLEKDGGVHQIPGGGSYRGYGDQMSPIVPDGSAVKRTGVTKVVDARELFARRATLPTFVVCCQSTRRSTGWLWWHHTVLFVVDHRDGSRLYRIAADGSKGTKGYSATAMKWVEVTAANVAQYDAMVYRAYGADTVDGTYGDQQRPLASVAFETT